MHSESIQTPWLFPHLVTLQPYSKINLKRKCSSSVYTPYPSQSENRFLDIFANKISHLHVLQIFKPFTQYFVEAPLASITSLSLLGYDATSVAHLCLGSFTHSSLQILSSSFRLDGERCCTATSRSLQRCSIGFKSGLWLGHSRTFRDLSRSHSCVFLIVCLGFLSCCKVNLWPDHSGAGFHQGTLCTLLRSSLPRSWLVSQFILLKNIPTAWCCHHHASP